MRPIALIVGLSIVSSPVFAQARRDEFTAPVRADSTAMTCQAAKTFILEKGAAVLSTGNGTYDRYVRDQSFCYPQQIGKTAFAPTRDNPRCYVGLTCEERDPVFPH